MPSVASMQDLGWGNPNTPGFEKKNIVVIEAGGIRLRVHKELAKIFKAFIEDMVKMGVVFTKKADDWGYANRNIRGSSSKSYHAWGLAIDLNAIDNPLASHHTTFPETATRALAHKYSLRWGLDYRGRKDPMHFEFTGSLDQARHISSTL